MYNQTAAKFRLEPGCLRRHDVTTVGNGNDLVHADGMEGESKFHLSAVHTCLQFFQTAQSADEVDA